MEEPLNIQSEVRLAFLYTPEEELQRLESFLKREASSIPTETISLVEVKELILPGTLDGTLLFVSVNSPSTEVESDDFRRIVSEILVLRAIHRSFPWVALLSNELLDIAPVLRAMGAICVFFRPYNLFDVCDSISKYLKDPSRFIEATTRFGCLELLQMCNLLSLDASIQLHSKDGKSGRIELRDGEFLHACTENHQGQDALRALLCWSDASVQIQPSVDSEPTLSGTFFSILEDGFTFSFETLWQAREMISSDGLASPQPSIMEFEKMADLNAICREVVDDVTDALACGIVDLNSGMLLGAHHNVHYFTQAYLDAVAAAAVDMFRGKNVRRVEQLLSKHRGHAVKDTLQEVFTKTDNTFHFMKVLASKGSVVVLVTRTTTNQGMGWSGLRVACDDIEAAL